MEGNIASGKSSFLEYLSNQKNIEVLYEPLKEWQTLEGGNLIVSRREGRDLVEGRAWVGVIYKD